MSESVSAGEVYLPLPRFFLFFYVFLLTNVYKCDILYNIENNIRVGLRKGFVLWKSDLK